MSSGISLANTGTTPSQADVIRDLNRMMHDLAGVARQFRDCETALAPVGNVVRMPGVSPTYVMQYRDPDGASRFAVVRAVIAHTGATLTVSTSRGSLTVAKAGIEDWVPIAADAEDPFPAGWWRTDGTATPA